MARAKAMAPRSPENIIMCWMLELIFTLRRRFNTAATLIRWYRIDRILIVHYFSGILKVKGGHKDFRVLISIKVRSYLTEGKR